MGCHKNINEILKSPLSVDKWKKTHEIGPDTTKDNLVETYEGEVNVDQTDEQKYMGFILSSKGNNMANINAMKLKSKGIIRKIFSRLDSLNLQKYYFECALILMNAMLGSSILYASDMYYNLKEIEIRNLERIEEGFLRELFKAGKSCPISQLYLEIGQYPARFEIMKMRLLLMNYILNNDSSSLIHKFFELQIAQPVKGDWASTCFKEILNFQ